MPAAATRSEFIPLSQAIREYVAQRHEPERSASHNEEPETIRGETPMIEGKSSSKHKQAIEPQLRTLGGAQIKSKGKGRAYSQPQPKVQTMDINK